MTWEQDSKWEADWWGNCANTLREELLQLAYATRMGLTLTPDDRTPYRIDMQGKSVLDIGGGPCSLLLKCVNVDGEIFDPCVYPDWIHYRYRDAGITYVPREAENELLYIREFDEVWIYNVLQHTQDPKRIIYNAKHYGKTIRLFEWINAGTGPGHPHELTEDKLNEWLGGKGMTEQNFAEHGACGHCYYGVFES